MTKLKDLVSEKYFSLNEKDNLDGQPKKLSLGEKQSLLKKISEYNKIGKELYSETSMIDIAKNLQQIAEFAQQIAFDEAEGDFDKITINRNMKEIKTLAQQFGKSATEAKAYKERLVALYEDIGRLLQRYFDIAELREEGIDEGNGCKCEKCGTPMTTESFNQIPICDECMGR